MQRRAPRLGTSLSGDGFERLLALLGPDRDRAGEQYEAIRSKLVKFFQWRGWTPAEELADETIDRVCSRLGQGELIRGSDPFHYFHGVAKNVLREAWADDRRAKSRHQEIGLLYRKGDDRWSDVDQADKAEEFEMRLDCLRRCLEHLDPVERDLIGRYYRGQGGDRIENRRQMADELGIPLNTLRIRIHRIRTRLAACVADALRRAEHR